jgi:hypothetical protein
MELVSLKKGAYLIRAGAWIKIYFLIIKLLCAMVAE